MKFFFYIRRKYRQLRTISESWIPVITTTISTLFSYALVDYYNGIFRYLGGYIIFDHLAKRDAAGNIIEPIVTPVTPPPPIDEFDEYIDDDPEDIIIEEYIMEDLASSSELYSFGQFLLLYIIRIISSILNNPLVAQLISGLRGIITYMLTDGLAILIPLLFLFLLFIILILIRLWYYVLNIVIGMTLFMGLNFLLDNIPVAAVVGCVTIFILFFIIYKQFFYLRSLLKQQKYDLTEKNSRNIKLFIFINVSFIVTIFITIFILLLQL